MAVQWMAAKESKIDCACEADSTHFSTVIRSMRGRPGKRQWKRSQMVMHYRSRDEAHFWHWKDQSSRLHE